MQLAQRADMRSSRTCLALSASNYFGAMDRSISEPAQAGVSHYLMEDLLE